VNFRVLGWFENGFRHISNRVHSVHTPQDLSGLRMRVLPSEVHARTFELLGARPMPMDLSQAIEMIKNGSLDAQENPLSNTVTYGVHAFHRFHTLSHHFYVSRPIFLNRTAFDGWPASLQAAMRAAVGRAVVWQRDMHEAEEKVARQAIEAQGCDIVTLTEDEREAFATAVASLRGQTAEKLGSELLALAQ